MNALPEPLQSRMLAAGETWLVWCATHGVNPLDTTVDELARAALDLHACGGTETEVLDLIDQVGFMSGLWRTTGWRHLRRTVTFADELEGGAQNVTPDSSGTQRTHGPGQCAGDRACPIHRPLDHPLRTAPLAWRDDGELLERICAHGVHHPDVDSLAYLERTHPSTHHLQIERHDCDGCCGTEA